MYYKLLTTELQLLQLRLKHFDVKELRLIANNVLKCKNTVITRFDTLYFLQNSSCLDQLATKRSISLEHCQSPFWSLLGVYEGESDYCCQVWCICLRAFAYSVEEILIF